MTFSPDPRKNADAAPVVESFRSQNIEPEGYTLYTYGAIQAWKQAVEKVGDTEPEQVAEALHDMEFDTVLGKFSFDSKGDVTAPGYVFYVWQDGNYDYVQ